MLRQVGRPLSLRREANAGGLRARLPLSGRRTRWRDRAQIDQCNQVLLARRDILLWGAQLGAPAIWLLPVAFPIMMAFGGLLGLAGIALPALSWASRCRPSCSVR